MALMYDMETVNKAMTEAAKLYDPKKPSIRVKRVLDIFAGMKPVQVEPVAHAYWYGSEFDGYADGGPVYDTWGCSHCHEEVNSEGFPPSYDYCPYCGAKMDEEAVEE